MWILGVGSTETVGGTNSSVCTAEEEGARKWHQSNLKMMENHVENVMEKKACFMHSSEEQPPGHHTDLMFLFAEFFPLFRGLSDV